MEIPSPSIKNPLPRGTAARVAAVFLAATGSASAAGIFSWDPPSPPVTDTGGARHALFRSILQDPQFDSESFWERDRRWTERLKRKHASSATVPLRQSGGVVPDIRLTDWMGVTEFSFAFAPLSLGGGLLLLRRRKSGPWLATG